MVKVVEFKFDDRPISACPGDSVAAALIAAGIGTFRTTVVDSRPRGPFCMMGVCFDCLVEVDGIPNLQACMTIVESGMRVKSMLGARRAGSVGTKHTEVNG